MIEVVSLIIPFFGLILVGVVSVFLSRHDAAALGWLNFFVIYVALPALFIKLLANTPIEEFTRWSFILTNLAVTFGILVIGFVLGLVASGGRIGEATIQSLAGGYGNIGHMGPGLALLAFGERAAVPVALIFCFENIMHFVLAPAMMALDGKGAEPAGWLALRVLGRIAGHPFIVATAIGVGIAVTGVEAPAPVWRLVEYLAQAAAPCALFAMGVTLALRPLRRVPPALLFLVPIKLVLHPVAMLAALTAFGPFDPVWVLSAVMLAALPTATNVFVIAQQYGVWAERASATVLVTTVVSVGTVSAFLYAVKAGYLARFGLGAL